ncbi:hypothetical protein DVA67_003430 [Solirubrobacter sp. CPCC 204708]|uniref:KTSC domain-containing protein n=1 Tax=Solirubrobacter deserti TaxID=2282478 RepID=A0ABT4RNP2_9ACTN|nr:hypothetical protein [Solirubrobacter deserti]MBE2315011.1 hypothetical protein [Solirubrobacter deserti]MDA0139926.1 hypothetical protein [Solirubrobacter deserti]
MSLTSAEATFWSSLPVGVTDAQVVAAWAAAANDVWRDETHVADGHAEFLFNSGHVRTTVAECVLLVAPVWTTTDFLTAVTKTSFGLNLGWALHTRTLDALTGGRWENPLFGEQAVRRWSEREQLRRQAHVDPAALDAVRIDREERFALERDRVSGRTFVSVAVSHSAVEWSEWYEVDGATFEGFLADPAAGRAFVARVRNGELEHLRRSPSGASR